jgi:hypothetical protein
MTEELEPIDQNSDDLAWVDELLDELLNGEDADQESDHELAESRERLVADLVAQGSTIEDASGWVEEFSDYMTNEVECLADDNEELLALLDGPFKVLRDDTFPDPSRFLVWDKKATPCVQALTFEEATERYPCGGEGSGWVPEDLQEIKQVKQACLEETRDSYSKRDADPDYEGLCSTPALFISSNPLRAHRWSEVKAYLSPEAEVANR